MFCVEHCSCACVYATIIDSTFKWHSNLNLILFFLGFDFFDWNLTQLRSKPTDKQNIKQNVISGLQRGLSIRTKQRNQ